MCFFHWCIMDVTCGVIFCKENDFPLFTQLFALEIGINIAQKGRKNRQVQLFHEKLKNQGSVENEDKCAPYFSERKQHFLNSSPPVLLTPPKKLLSSNPYFTQ